MNIWTIVLLGCAAVHLAAAFALLSASAVLAGVFGTAAILCFAGAFVSAAMGLAREFEP